MKTIISSFMLSVPWPCTWKDALHNSVQSPKGRLLNLCMCSNQQNKRLKKDVSGSEDLWPSLSKYVSNPNAKSDCDSASEDDILGFSSSLFEDSFPLETEEERPPEYVPPPSINKTDLEFIEKLENTLYILRYVLPGSVRKNGMENELSDACGIVHNEIRFQDPLMCIHGKQRLLQWLQILAEADAVLDLHEIYSESIRSRPVKGCIYAVWTLSLPHEASAGSVKEPQQITFSGQSKVGINSDGQVISVHSQWHNVKEGKMMEVINKCFADMLLKAEI